MSRLYLVPEQRSSGWPIGALESLAQYAGPILERMIGPPLTPDDVMRRAFAIPLHNAELGAKAVEDGHKKRDEELSNYGAAMVERALLDVEDPDGTLVPSDVAEEVGNIARSLTPEHWTENPYVSSKDADRVVTILGGEGQLPL